MSTPVPAYFGAPEGLPVPLDAETPTKKGAGKKRKAKEPQVRPRWAPAGGSAGAERIAGRPLGAHICPPEALPLCPAPLFCLLPGNLHYACSAARCSPLGGRCGRRES